MMVRVGLAQPEVGNRLPSLMNRLSSLMGLSPAVTDAGGRVIAHARRAHVMGGREHVHQFEHLFRSQGFIYPAPPVQPVPQQLAGIVVMFIMDHRDGQAVLVLARGVQGD